MKCMFCSNNLIKGSYGYLCYFCFNCIISFGLSKDIKNYNYIYIKTNDNGQFIADTEGQIDNWLFSFRLIDKTCICFSPFKRKEIIRINNINIMSLQDAKDLVDRMSKLKLFI